MSQQSTTNFRYDINALRSIAVTAVLFFHYKVPGFSGGFTGVDVFFVISGYLMSKIIITGINNGSFSVLDFYGKRLKRIVPALMVLIAAINIISFFNYFPSDYQLIQKNSAGSILFISNFFYWLDSGYFAEASDSNILLHTWSLSVEWQFYMIYPLLLLLVGKFLKRKIPFIWVFVVLTLMFYLATVFYAQKDRDAAFYLLPTRCWEMMFGGIALLVEGFLENIKFKKALVLFGYGGILISILLLNSNIVWPGKYTIIPVFATFLVVALRMDNFKILRSESVQLLGKMSYSLYLWHWPVYVIAQYWGFDTTIINTLVMVLIAGLLGFLSFKYIESAKFNNQPVLAAMTSLAILTGLLSYYEVNAFVFSKEALQVIGFKKRYTEKRLLQFNEGTCYISRDISGSKKYNKVACLEVLEGRKNILLIGDSHAGHIASPLKDRLAKMHVNLMQASASSCLPLVNAKGASFCSEIMNYIYKDFVVNNFSKIDGVIISANWVTAADERKLLYQIKSTVEYLNRYNIKTVIIGQNETYKISYPLLKAKEIQYGVANSKKNMVEKSFSINGYLKQNLKQYYIDVINNEDPGMKADTIPYMLDKNHYTTYGAEIAIKKILENPLITTLIK